MHKHGLELSVVEHRQGYEWQYQMWWYDSCKRVIILMRNLSALRSGINRGVHRWVHTESESAGQVR